MRSKLMKSTRTDLRLSNGWFEQQAEPIWNKYLLPLNGQVRSYLEVGCCEGRSLVWILENLDPSLAVGVDPYIPPRRMQADAYRTYRDNCRWNLTRWIQDGKVRLYEHPSSWLMTDRGWRRVKRESFDLCYLDGSHLASDLMLDAILCWERLRRGGIMVFDDMQRRWHLGRALVRPAVMAFMTIYDSRWEMFFMEPRQLAIRKLK